MGTRLRGPCSAPGCPGRATERGRCEEHQRPDPRKAEQAVAYDRWRGSASSRGYDARWQRLRLMALAREPLCRRCKERGVVTAATLVDHIRPLRSGGTNSDSNLQSLCVACHAEKTAQDQVTYGS